RGEGPTLIEALTYRWGDHSMRANLPQYRTEDEVQQWRKLDAVLRFEDKLTSTYGFTREALDRIREEVEAELRTAREFAIASPEPTLQDLEHAVYAPHY